MYGRLKFSPDPFLLLETSTFRCLTAYEPMLPSKKETTASSVAAPAAPIRKTLAPTEKEEQTLPVHARANETGLPDTSPISPSIPVARNTETPSPGSFDFTRFIEHIRSVPKRSFVGL